MTLTKDDLIALQGFKFDIKIQKVSGLTFDCLKVIEKLQNENYQKEILQAFEDAEKWKHVVDQTGSQLFDGYIKYKKLVELIKKRQKQLLLFCGVCNKRLEFQGTQPHYTILACSGKKSEGRTLADEHYSKSRVELSYDDVKKFEALDRELQSLLDEVEK